MEERICSHWAWVTLGFAGCRARIRTALPRLPLDSTSANGAVGALEGMASTPSDDRERRRVEADLAGNAPRNPGAVMRRCDLLRRRRPPRRSMRITVRTLGPILGRPPKSIGLGSSGRARWVVYEVDGLPGRHPKGMSADPLLRTDPADFRRGVDFHLGYSPERNQPGRSEPIASRSIVKVVAGEERV